MGKFSPRFIGLLGTQDELAKVWEEVHGVTVEDDGETHHYFIYVIDHAGNSSKTFMPNSLFSSRRLADVRLLLAEKQVP